MSMFLTIRKTRPYGLGFVGSECGKYRLLSLTSSKVVEK